MNLFLFIVALVVYDLSLAKKINVEELRCLVCRTSLTELSKEVNNIDPTKTVDVGGYRLDSEGNYKQKSVSQAKSEIHLSDLIENICTKMDDYVRATWKSNGKLTLLKLLGDDGQMNSAMSEVDIIQDEDLNKSLKYYCEGIMEELEDNIIKHFQRDTVNIKNKICSEESDICINFEEISQNSKAQEEL